MNKKFSFLFFFLLFHYTIMCQNKKHKIGFNGEVNYSRKNIKNDFFGYALNYLVLNIMPNYYFDKSETTVYTGGYIAALVSYKVLNDNPKSGERFQQFDSGLTLGVNQKLIEISIFQVTLDARINKGFMNVRDETWQGKTKNYSYSLGLIFSLIEV